jgi:hypothetical protein
VAIFLAGCLLDASPVFGTTPSESACDAAKPLGAYDAASSICRAAMHAGVLTDAGGEFNVAMVARLSGARCVSRSNGAFLFIFAVSPVTVKYYLWKS